MHLLAFVCCVLLSVYFILHVCMCVHACAFRHVVSCFWWGMYVPRRVAHKAGLWGEVGRLRIGFLKASILQLVHVGFNLGRHKLLTGQRRSPAMDISDSSPDYDV